LVLALLRQRLHCVDAHLLTFTTEKKAGAPSQQAAAREESRDPARVSTKMKMSPHLFRRVRWGNSLRMRLEILVDLRLSSCVLRGSTDVRRWGTRDSAPWRNSHIYESRACRSRIRNWRDLLLRTT